MASNHSYKAAIDQAQARVLEKDREGAARILMEALRSEKKDSVGHKELTRVLEQLSEMFFAEKTQQSFELGRAMAATDLNSGIAHFKEALKAEPDNLGIRRALGRALLGLGDCEQVLSVADEALKSFAMARDMALLKIQALACLKRPEEMRAFLKATEANLLPLQVQLELAQSQAYFFEDKLDLALGCAQKAKSMDPDFPESYYWLAQISEKSGKEDQAYARVYVQLCKEMTSKARKKYEAEPRTCLESRKIQTKMETRPQAPPAKGTPKTPSA